MQHSVYLQIPLCITKAIRDKIKILRQIIASSRQKIQVLYEEGTKRLQCTS